MRCVLACQDECSGSSARLRIQIRHMSHIYLQSHLRLEFFQCAISITIATKLPFIGSKKNFGHTIL